MLGLDATGLSAAIDLPGTCPFCHHDTTFTRVTEQYVGGSEGASRSAGMCRCVGCDSLVMIHRVGRIIIQIFPKVAIASKVPGTPAAVQQVIDEAMRCQLVGAHSAAAIMLRRAVEIVCGLEGVPSGQSLSRRVGRLALDRCLDQNVADAFKEVRSFGGDTDQVDLTSFDHIGREEVFAAVAVVNSLLSSLYGVEDPTVQVANRFR